MAFTILPTASSNDHSVGAPGINFRPRLAERMLPAIQLQGSGSSTFSAWAAFLGQHPVFTAPGHPFTTMSLKPRSGQMIPSFDPRNPAPEALDAMCEAVSDPFPIDPA